MDRYICIHGHFYQPPRENPWLETIEPQNSAFPYHDWNERINAECYAPNARSPILDGNGNILSIVNNYARISFNFGPTLLSWLEKEAPDVYDRILEADRDSQVRFSGHGSALAQAYNHMILPLANHRDRITQIRWGIRDFELRFGRTPEGLWLPETAVDLETLDSLAQEGIRFTILAPSQARHIRKMGESQWQSVEGAIIDTTQAYMATLPSGAKITLFFYDGPISRAVAFEKLLTNGEQFAHRLLSIFSDDRSWPQLANISTDGETYGHHHRHGEMALAYALHYIDTHHLAILTNYGEYLEKYPPTHEVELFENSSWSCAHGIERWRSNCGCSTGANEGWSQEWRDPLRNTFDWLRDTLTPLYEEKSRDFFYDPWEARNEYIDVILNRSGGTINAFFNRHATHVLSADDRTTALKLMELQRHLMLMYTSCGWFFDDLSGIETVQVIQYASRALQLAEDLFKQSYEEAFISRLAAAKSNIPEFKDGRTIYMNFVKPACVDLEKVTTRSV